MNARALNTVARAMVALLLTGAAVVAGWGCGGGGTQSVSGILNAAFHPAKPVNSGRLDLALDLSATGLSNVTAPVSLHLSGPFQATSRGQLPRFALGISIASSGRNLQVGATSTGSQFFIELQGVPFVAPASAYQQLKQGYSQAAASSSRSGSQPTFASLGADPSTWLVHPAMATDQSVGGVDAVHVTSGLNVARFLSDLGRISSAGSVLGLGGVSQVSSLSPAQRAAIARSVTSARVDVLAGRADHVLRELAVHVALAVAAPDRPLLRGLSSGQLSLGLQFSDVNLPQTIAAPSNPQPLSKLASLLGQLGIVSSTSGQAPSGSSASASAPASGSNASSAAASNSAYLACAQRAGQDLAALQRCGPLLK